MYMYGRTFRGGTGGRGRAPGGARNTGARSRAGEHPWRREEHAAAATQAHAHAAQDRARPSSARCGARVAGGRPRASNDDARGWCPRTHARRWRPGAARWRGARSPARRTPCQVYAPRTPPTRREERAEGARSNRGCDADRTTEATRRGERRLVSTTNTKKCGLLYKHKSQLATRAAGACAAAAAAAAPVRCACPCGPCVAVTE